MKYKLNGQWYDISVPSYDATPVGTIIPYAGENIPTGYILCNGQQVFKANYPELYIAIQDAYNLPSDTDTLKFRVPNIKGRVLVGLDTSQTEFDTLGETGGSKELQAHHHDALSQLGIASGNGDTTGDINNISVNWQTNVRHFKVDQTIGTGDSGNLQPYIVVNYIIKAHPSSVNTSEVVNEHSTSETDVYSANQTNVEIENAVKDVYSTNEVKTNEVWIDNKPIYKKTIDLTSGWNIGSEVQLSHNIVNVDNMLKYEGTAYRIDGQNQMIPSNFGSNNYVLSVFDMSNTKYRLYVGSSFSGSNALTHIYITFYYTKTTD